MIHMLIKMIQEDMHQKDHQRRADQEEREEEEEVKMKKRTSDYY